MQGFQKHVSYLDALVDQLRKSNSPRTLKILCCKLLQYYLRSCEPGTQGDGTFSARHRVSVQNYLVGQDTPNVVLSLLRFTDTDLTKEAVSLLNLLLDDGSGAVNQEVQSNIIDLFQSRGGGLFFKTIFQILQVFF